MNRLVSSKHLESVSDLTLSAPIKQGFIEAFEAVSYETRLRKLLEALFKIRSTAREHSKIKPFVDTAERIQSLLDFRLAIVNSEPRRLMLSATFDRPFEPYMRLIWDPLGPLLDVIFCNCDGYVTATDHGFEEYLAWVRSAQIDTDYFYSMSGHSVSDVQYLLKLEQLEREAPWRSTTLVFAPNPEKEAAGVRKRHLAESNLLGMEALIALYRLTDFYPPDQPKSDSRYLRFAAQQLLKGWGPDVPYDWKKTLIPEQWRWFRDGNPDAAPRKQTTGTSTSAQEALEKEWQEERCEDEERARIARLKFHPDDIQGGIITDYGNGDGPNRSVRHGALLLMRIVDEEKARAFVRTVKPRIPTEAQSAAPKSPIFYNLAFTCRGLANIGVAEKELARFPQEFREGMEARAGLLGDLRDNHPRNWTLPHRYSLDTGETLPDSPPVDMSEVDIVIQLRTFARQRDDEAEAGICPQSLQDEIRKIGTEAAESGVELLAVQPMRRATEDRKAPGADHFGFQDGFSQPKPVDHTPHRYRDEVARGELLWGYPNDRSDAPPAPSDILDNGTFLVVRKLSQDVRALRRFVKEQAHMHKIGEEKLYGKMMGRMRNGKPMLPRTSTDSNMFSYAADEYGIHCPFQAHIRRANPRAPREGQTRRPNPRILRRGLSYGPPVVSGVNEDAERGIVFMAYNASIAEQYEVIQRWVNGGNSTGVGSWQSDPLMGIFQDESECRRLPETGEDPDSQQERERVCVPGRIFRFRYWGRREQPAPGDDLPHPGWNRKFRTIRVNIPQAFVTLRWGTYLFVPSMRAIDVIADVPRDAVLAAEAKDVAAAAKGEEIVARLLKLAEQGQEGRRSAAAAWKDYLEDFSSKDPAERAEGPAIWAAIRRYHRGALRVPYGVVPKGIDPPDVVLAASKDLVMRVFHNPDGHYSMCGQMDRMRQSFGEIYLGLDKGAAYDAKSKPNVAIWAIEEPQAFEVARRAANTWLAQIFHEATPFFPDGKPEVDLRRDFVTPVLGLICNFWFGVPDTFAADPADIPQPEPDSADTENHPTPPPPPRPPAPPADECNPPHVYRGGWSWRTDRKPRCPGDYLATSRYCFYPDPVPRVQAYGREQGQALRKAVNAHFEQLAREKRFPTAPLSKAIATIFSDRDEIARTVIGVMTGFLPPADASLRWTFYEWLEEKLLWRIQHDLITGDATATPYDRANRALRPWLERAMQKRPSPDLLWRTALSDHRLGGVEVKTDDKIVIGIVSALAEDAAAGITDVYPIFGGERDPVDGPLHACPAYKAAMGTMLGILSSVLDLCEVQALPAPLLVKLRLRTPPTTAAAPAGSPVGRTSASQAP